MTKSLTEQFLDDEIDESKLYYFKQKMSEEIEVGKPFALNIVRAIDETYLDWFLIDKIIAPVPSYGELQNMNKAINECMSANIKLVEQNTKLKELLKELKRYFDKDGKYYIEKRILLEINQVLDDNKIQANTVACNKIQENE